MNTFELLFSKALFQLRLKSLIFGLVLAMAGQVVHSQVMISDGGTVTTCGDIFYDDQVGADGDGGPYTDNDYILTLCPDVPGTAVSVNFLGFDVQTNANPNNNDVLYVFDGETCLRT